MTKRSIDRAINDALDERSARRRAEERTRRLASRTDPRPQITAPAADDPWLPTMGVLNDVLRASKAAEPPMRDIDGVVFRVRTRRVPGMHLLTAAGVNHEEEDVGSRLPAPEQPLLTRPEQHIEHVAPDGRPVHLPPAFVRHFHTRDDDALPIAASIATLPIVLPGNTLLAGRGLNRERGIIFRIPHQLLDILPKPDECTADAAGRALAWLCDEWLVDVAADFTGKCILIAAALTIIERSVLPERPCFFVTAGRRGGGKTTTLIMLLMAVTGVRASAAAWSPNEEERRKALLAYMLEALPAIISGTISRAAHRSAARISRSPAPPRSIPTEGSA